MSKDKRITDDVFDGIIALLREKKYRRVRKNFFIETNEQDYVDNKFEEIQSQLDILLEKSEIVDCFTNKEYILINPNDELNEPMELRKKASDDGYYHLTTYKILGELWVKKEK